MVGSPVLLLGVYTGARLRRRYRWKTVSGKGQGVHDDGNVLVGAESYTSLAGQEMNFTAGKELTETKWPAAG